MTTHKPYDWFEVKTKIYGGDPHTGHPPEVEIQEIKIGGSEVGYEKLSPHLRGIVEKIVAGEYKEPMRDYRRGLSQTKNKPV